MCSIWFLVSPKSKIFYCIYLNVNYVGGAMGYGRQQFNANLKKNTKNFDQESWGQNQILCAVRESNVNELDPIPLG